MLLTHEHQNLKCLHIPINILVRFQQAMFSIDCVYLTSMHALLLYTHFMDFLPPLLKSQLMFIHHCLHFYVILFLFNQVSYISNRSSTSPDTPPPHPKLPNKKKPLFSNFTLKFIGSENKIQLIMTSYQANKLTCINSVIIKAFHYNRHIWALIGIHCNNYKSGLYCAQDLACLIFQTLYRKVNVYTWVCYCPRRKNELQNTLHLYTWYL